MDSLLANYASSDEEEHPNPPPSLSFFASLPKPKTSQPSTTISLHQEPEKPPNPTSKLFSSLPPPKSDTPASKTRRIVQIRAPVNPFARKSAQLDDDDDDEEERERKRRKESESSAEAPSVKSFLSSIPAPRNSASLGALPSSGSGRRAIVEADVPASSSDAVEDQQPGVDNYGNYANYEQQADQNAGNYYGAYESGVGDQNSAGVDPSSYSNYQSYGNYGEYGHYRDNWADGSAAEVAAASDRAFRVPGKRGKNEVPTEIVEVKQDELMKNRPREDQAKLTGIAFGPSYQPASSKGKPSKLHKRKHQIGTLYFDMKQKEMELAERRAKGFLTKAETQAKYGW